MGKSVVSKIDYKNLNLIESVVEVKRVSRTKKGGRRLSFMVVVLVGDGKGNVGYGIAKHAEVVEAKAKAIKKAKSKIVHISLKDGKTIYHQLTSKFGASKLFLKPAVEGTGVIAGGAVRKFCEVAGISDIIAKSYGTSCSHALIYNMFKALRNIYPMRYIVNKRSKSVKLSESV